MKKTRIKKKDWLKIHKDFRGYDEDQNPMMLKYIEGKGTCLIPVEFENEENPYRFGDFNPSVSTRNYRGRGGHETGGSQQ